MTKTEYSPAILTSSSTNQTPLLRWHNAAHAWHKKLLPPAKKKWSAKSDDNKEKWGEGAGIGAQCCGPAIASGKGGTVLGWAVRAYLLGRPDPEERRDGRHSGAARAVSGLLFGKCNAGSRASSFNSRQIRTRGRLSGHDPYQGTALRP